MEEEQELYEDSTDEKPPSKTNQWDSLVIFTRQEECNICSEDLQTFHSTNLWTYAITQLFEVSITTRYQPMNDSNHSSGKMSGVI